MMVQAPPKPAREKPWTAYQTEPQYRLLEPGWGGSLEPEEIKFIQAHLKADPALAYWWGFKPGQRSRSVSAIERVAMHGSPEVRSENAKFTRVDFKTTEQFV